MCCAPTVNRPRRRRCGIAELGHIPVGAVGREKTYFRHKSSHLSVAQDVNNNQRTFTKRLCVFLRDLHAGLWSINKFVNSMVCHHRQINIIRMIPDPVNFWVVFGVRPLDHSKTSSDFKINGLISFLTYLIFVINFIARKIAYRSVTSNDIKCD